MGLTLGSRLVEGGPGGAPVKSRLGGHGRQGQCRGLGLLLLGSFLHPPRTKGSAEHVHGLAASHSRMKGWEQE